MRRIVMGKRMKALLLTSTLMAVLTLTGCSPVEKTIKFLVGVEEPAPITQEDGKELGEAASEVEQGARNSDEQYLGAPPEQGANLEEQGTGEAEVITNEKVKVVLYFSNPEGTGLVQEIREIPKREGIGRATIEELIKGPKPESGLAQTIPSGTELLDINVKSDGTAVVSFSEEIKVNHWGGSSGEGLTVYSIVNTLTQFPSVERVQILVDNKVIETLGGHIDISQPVEKEAAVIKTR